MRERDLQQGEALLTRRAQLIAAAEALVVWMHDRRATWANDPLPAAQKFSPTPAVSTHPKAAPQFEALQFEAPQFEAPQFEAPQFEAAPVEAPPAAPAYMSAPAPVFERPPAPTPMRPAEEPSAPYERPPAYQPPRCHGCFPMASMCAPRCVRV